jgi:hypothetical protein
MREHANGGKRRKKQVEAQVDRRFKERYVLKVEVKEKTKSWKADEEENKETDRTVIDSK